MKDRNTESVDCRKVKFVERPGDFAFSKGNSRIVIWLPGQIHAVALPITPVDPVHWTWDGNEEKPTLTPSILCKGETEWHGWLRNGRLESC